MKTIAIYPGHFQPATKAHFNVYKKLRKMVGADVFVAVTSGEPNEHAPLDVNDKILIWVRHGVPASHIIKVADWKKPTEIFEKFSSSSTAAIFALTQKEVEELSPRRRKARQSKNESEAPQDPNKEIWVDTNGKPSYFQPHVGNESEMEPFSKHGYVTIVDDSHIDGQPISTANIRQVIGGTRYTDEQKKKFFGKVFGWFDIGLYGILSQKFKMASQTTGDETPIASPTPVVGTAPKPVSGKEQLRQMVRECLKEMLEGSLDGGGALGGNEDDVGDMADTLDKEKSAAEKNKDQKDQQMDLLQQKKDLERKNKLDQSQLKRDKDSVDMARKVTLQRNRQELDALNKAIATSKTVPTL